MIEFMNDISASDVTLGKYISVAIPGQRYLWRFQFRYRNYNTGLTISNGKLSSFSIRERDLPSIRQGVDDRHSVFRASTLLIGIGKDVYGMTIHDYERASPVAVSKFGCVVELIKGIFLLTFLSQPVRLYANPSCTEYVFKASPLYNGGGVSSNVFVRRT